MCNRSELLKLMLTVMQIRNACGRDAVAKAAVARLGASS